MSKHFLSLPSSYGVDMARVPTAIIAGVDVPSTITTGLRGDPTTLGTEVDFLGFFTLGLGTLHNGMAICPRISVALKRSWRVIEIGSNSS